MKTGYNFIRRLCPPLNQNPPASRDGIEITDENKMKTTEENCYLYQGGPGLPVPEFRVKTVEEAVRYVKRQHPGYKVRRKRNTILVYTEDGSSIETDYYLSNDRWAENYRFW